jgi:hypothetical protein
MVIRIAASRQMKFLNKLLGKDDDTPKWAIKAPTERPAARKRNATVAAEVETAPQPKAKDPFLDDPTMNTMSLEADFVPEDNPYVSKSLEDEMEDDTRKLRTIQTSDKFEKPIAYNPYDTGSMRRGWKE